MDWPAALAAVEAALVAEGLRRPVPVVALAPEVAAAARAAIAAKFLAVSTPRTLAVINLGDRAAGFVAAQAAYADPRRVVSWAAGDPPAALATALASDIVIAAGPVAIERKAIRHGTHLTALDPGVELAPELLAAAEVYDDSRLAGVVAGLADGRQRDEITVLVLA